MYNRFFYPYEKAKLWTGNLIGLSISNFLLYASFYMMLLPLPLWMVEHGDCGYAEAGAAVAVFGLGMFLPGVFNSYLIDTFSRKNVCVMAMLLFTASGALYPRIMSVWPMGLLRLVQGGLFGIITMTTGSTMVIDVTASRRRTDANIVFSWSGRLGMVAGLVVGTSLYPYRPFQEVAYAGVALSALALLPVMLVNTPFRAPLRTPWCSLDRFVLPRTFLPGLNMMPVAIVFGVLATQIYHNFFYFCMLVGFLIALLLLRYVLVDAHGRAEVEFGQAAMIGGLLLLVFSRSLVNSYIAGVLIGIGIGSTVSRFFVKMIKLSRHCERGTGNNTYQLMWELGMAIGFLVGNVWSVNHSVTIYWVCIGICVWVLLMYELFTHSWYGRKMEER